MKLLGPKKEELVEIIQDLDPTILQLTVRDNGGQAVRRRVR